MHDPELERNQNLKTSNRICGCKSDCDDQYTGVNVSKLSARYLDDILGSADGNDNEKLILRKFQFT